MQARLGEAEADRVRFCREVITAVTRGKFELTDAFAIPDPGRPIAEVAISDADGYAAARQMIREYAEQAGMDDERSGELVLAAGEAISNAVKHAREGTCGLYRREDSLVIRVSDSGSGVRPQDLASAVLVPGYSTKPSLGMGFTLMLRLSDHISMATGTHGTIVQVEKKIAPPEEDPLVSWVLERL